MNPAPCYALAGAVLVADQLTKLAAVAWLRPFESRHVLPGFDLTLLYNTGAAFSFLHGAGGWQRWVFVTLAVLVSAGIAVYLPRAARSEPRSAVALALILGGALGNLVDRLRFGHVVDFVDLHAAGYHWPAFNLADAAITLGAAALVLGGLSRPAGSDRPSA
jgi:signal peptidase II